MKFNVVKTLVVPGKEDLNHDNQITIYKDDTPNHQIWFDIKEICNVFLDSRNAVYSCTQRLRELDINFQLIDSKYIDLNTFARLVLGFRNTTSDKKLYIWVLNIVSELKFDEFTVEYDNMSKELEIKTKELEKIENKESKIISKISSMSYSDEITADELAELFGLDYERILSYLQRNWYCTFDKETKHLSFKYQKLGEIGRHVYLDCVDAIDNGADYKTYRFGKLFIFWLYNFFQEKNIDVILNI